jgi:hypothetical protein
MNVRYDAADVDVDAEIYLLNAKYPVELAVHNVD